FDRSRFRPSSIIWVDYQNHVTHEVTELYEE
ncbi:hypothetical protein L916_14349, partial [Phytophthora nicotianae]